MSSYYFTTVSGVLPNTASPKRSYVRPGCRPHLAWVGAVPMGEVSCLKGDGTGCRVAAHGQPSTGLSGLVTVDSANGSQLVAYGQESHVNVRRTATASLPSQRRIVATLLHPKTTAAAAAAAGVVGDLPPLLVSDDRGSIYEFAPLGGEPADRRARLEGAAVSTGSWRLLTPDRSPLPSSVIINGAHPPVPRGLDVSRGTPGWVGLGWSAATSHLICAREGFHDVRVLDLGTGDVVRTYGTTHGPSGMCVLDPGHGPLATCAIVTEGCLATLFDLRCPSAVVPLTSTTLAAMNIDEGNAAPPRSAADGSSLLVDRLTSTAGRITDACSTASPFEVALSIDRALCVYDYRKLKRLWTSSNVLKYSIGSIAATAGGRAVVCAGIDAEVRIVQLFPKDAVGEVQPLLSFADIHKQQATATSITNNVHAHGAVEPSTENTQAPAADDPSRSTFRTRLNTSVCCETTWQGGWVTALNEGHSIAVGVSMNNELFVAQ